MASFQVYSGSVDALLVEVPGPYDGIVYSAWRILSNEGGGSSWTPPIQCEGGDAQVYSFNADMLALDTFHEAIRLKDEDGKEVILGVYASYDSTRQMNCVRPSRKYNGNIITYNLTPAKYLAYVPLVVYGNGFASASYSPIAVFGVVASHQTVSGYTPYNFIEFVDGVSALIDKFKNEGLISGSACRYAINDHDYGTISISPAIGFELTYYSKSWINAVIEQELKGAEITLTPNYFYYDGQFKTPTVTVTVDDVQLTEGIDYIKTYENNRDPGLASVLVVGQGAYKGSRRVYFSIYSATEPYGNLEPSGPSNTTPTYDYTSDSVGKPSVPTLSMSDIGFVRIYNPSKTQLQSLAQYLWTDTTFLDTIINHAKQLLENPIDGIICLNLLPCDIPNGGTEEFKLLFVPTGVQLTVAANQFVEVNCGKVTIETVYGSALDYAPYTKASMFLPYVGQVSLNIDEIMGKTLRVYYHIDIVSGGCVAMVEVDGTVMYQFSGHCAISMPLTGADYSNLASAMISTVKAAATMGANAGAGIAQAAMEMMSGSSRQNDSTTKTLPGEALVAVGEGIEFTSLAARNIANTVGAVMGSKPEISRTGTFSGNTGYLGVRRPYVILERPRLCNPSEYGKFNGYPSMQTVALNNISGFTQVQQVQLTGISATASELNEIEKLLKSGVIL